jgi:membrane peptidoglycan carboxypeptidase
MARRYSASPHEGFFTGGGIHRFANFDERHDGQVLSLAAAFRESVNLPFIRLMRDIVKYHLAHLEPSAEAILADAAHPARHGYLTRFADREGRQFLGRFHQELAGLSPDAALEKLAAEVKPAAWRLATLFRTVRPDAEPSALAAFLGRWQKGATISEHELFRLYDAYAIDRHPLADRGYIAGVHPLKLWLAAFLQQHPDATRSEVMAASVAERQETYAWLFRTSRKGAKDKRIRILLEEEAFARVHAAWARLGYPFAELVPSYATAIGSSADRPEALAELMGIIVNDGLWQPAVRVQRLHFAAGTPYEAVLSRPTAPAREALAPEIAAVIRKAMIDVVEQGTARRLQGAFTTPDGGSMVIGAKTGTGDHRRKTFAPGGRLVKSRALNRTATVVFFAGDNLFGTVTIYVSGANAGNFAFTSSLPAQLLKALAPTIQPLLNERSLRTAEVADREVEVGTTVDKMRPRLPHRFEADAIEVF